MIVKIELVEEGIMPVKAKTSDACFDCYARHVENKGTYIEYFLGFKIEIPPGSVGLVFPRSSISEKRMYLSNSVGVIDSGYRGEVRARFVPTHDRPWQKDIYQREDRVCQLMIMPIPEIDLIQVSSLDYSADRGGGFGSTGK